MAYDILESMNRRVAEMVRVHMGERYGFLPLEAHEQGFQNRPEVKGTIYDRENPDDLSARYTSSYGFFGEAGSDNELLYTGTGGGESRHVYRGDVTANNQGLSITQPFTTGEESHFGRLKLAFENYAGLSQEESSQDTVTTEMNAINAGKRGAFGRSQLYVPPTTSPARMQTIAHQRNFYFDQSVQSSDRPEVLQKVLEGLYSPPTADNPRLNAMYGGGVYHGDDNDLTFVDKGVAGPTYTDDQGLLQVATMKNKGAVTKTGYVTNQRNRARQFAMDPEGNMTPLSSLGVTSTSSVVSAAWDSPEEGFMESGFYAFGGQPMSGGYGKRRAPAAVRSALDASKSTLQEGFPSYRPATIAGITSPADLNKRIQSGDFQLVNPTFNKRLGARTSVPVTNLRGSSATTINGPDRPMVIHGMQIEFPSSWYGQPVLTAEGGASPEEVARSQKEHDTRNAQVANLETLMRNKFNLGDEWNFTVGGDELRVGANITQLGHTTTKIHGVKSESSLGYVGAAANASAWHLEQQDSSRAFSALPGGPEFDIFTELKSPLAMFTASIKAMQPQQLSSFIGEMYADKPEVAAAGQQYIADNSSRIDLSDLSNAMGQQTYIHGLNDMYNRTIRPDVPLQGEELERQNRLIQDYGVGRASGWLLFGQFNPKEKKAYEEEFFRGLNDPRFETKGNPLVSDDWVNEQILGKGYALDSPEAEGLRSGYQQRPLLTGDTEGERRTSAKNLLKNVVNFQSTRVEGNTLYNARFYTEGLYSRHYQSSVEEYSGVMDSFDSSFMQAIYNQNFPDVANWLEENKFHDTGPRSALRQLRNIRVAANAQAYARNASDPGSDIATQFSYVTGSRGENGQGGFTNEEFLSVLNDARGGTAVERMTRLAEFVGPRMEKAGHSANEPIYVPELGTAVPNPAAMLETDTTEATAQGDGSFKDETVSHYTSQMLRQYGDIFNLSTGGRPDPMKIREMNIKLDQTLAPLTSGKELDARQVEQGWSGRYSADPMIPRGFGFIPDQELMRMSSIIGMGEEGFHKLATMYNNMPAFWNRDPTAITGSDENAGSMRPIKLMTSASKLGKLFQGAASSLYYEPAPMYVNPTEKSSEGDLDADPYRLLPLGVISQNEAGKWEMNRYKGGDYQKFMADTTRHLSTEMQERIHSAAFSGSDTDPNYKDPVRDPQVASLLYGLQTRVNQGDTQAIENLQKFNRQRNRPDDAPYVSPENYEARSKAALQYDKVQEETNQERISKSVMMGSSFNIYKRWTMAGGSSLGLPLKQITMASDLMARHYQEAIDKTGVQSPLGKMIQTSAIYRQSEQEANAPHGSKYKVGMMLKMDDSSSSFESIWDPTKNDAAGRNNFLRRTSGFMMTDERSNPEALSYYLANVPERDAAGNFDLEKFETSRKRIQTGIEGIRASGKSETERNVAYESLASNMVKSGDIGIRSVASELLLTQVAGRTDREDREKRISGEEFGDTRFYIGDKPDENGQDQGYSWEEFKERQMPTQTAFDYMRSYADNQRGAEENLSSYKRPEVIARYGLMMRERGLEKTFIPQEIRRNLAAPLGINFGGAGHITVNGAQINYANTAEFDQAIKQNQNFMAASLATAFDPDRPLTGDQLNVSSSAIGALSSFAETGDFTHDPYRVAFGKGMNFADTFMSADTRGRLGKSASFFQVNRDYTTLGSTSESMLATSPHFQANFGQHIGNPQEWKDDQYEPRYNYEHGDNKYHVSNLPDAIKFNMDPTTGRLASTMTTDLKNLRGLGKESPANILKAFEESGSYPLQGVSYIQGLRAMATPEGGNQERLWNRYKSTFDAQYKDENERRVAAGQAPYELRREDFADPNVKHGYQWFVSDYQNEAEVEAARKKLATQSDAEFMQEGKVVPFGNFDDPNGPMKKWQDVFGQKVSEASHADVQTMLPAIRYGAQLLRNRLKEINPDRWNDTTLGPDDPSIIGKWEGGGAEGESKFMGEIVKPTVPERKVKELYSQFQGWKAKSTLYEQTAAQQKAAERIAREAAHNKAPGTPGGNGAGGQGGGGGRGTNTDSLHSEEFEPENGNSGGSEGTPASTPAPSADPTVRRPGTVADMPVKMFEDIMNNVGAGIAGSIQMPSLQLNLGARNKLSRSQIQSLGSFISADMSSIDQVSSEYNEDLTSFMQNNYQTDSLEDALKAAQEKGDDFNTMFRKQKPRGFRHQKTLLSIRANIKAARHEQTRGPVEEAIRGLDLSGDPNDPNRNTDTADQTIHKFRAANDELDYSEMDREELATDQAMGNALTMKDRFGAGGKEEYPVGHFMQNLMVSTAEAGTFAQQSIKTMGKLGLNRKATSREKIQQAYQTEIASLDAMEAQLNQRREEVLSTISSEDVIPTSSGTGTEGSPEWHRSMAKSYHDYARVKQESEYTPSEMKKLLGIAEVHEAYAQNFEDKDDAATRRDNAMIGLSAETSTAASNMLISQGQTSRAKFDLLGLDLDSSAGASQRLNQEGMLGVSSLDTTRKAAALSRRKLMNDNDFLEGKELRTDDAEEMSTYAQLLREMPVEPEQAGALGEFAETYENEASSMRQESVQERNRARLERVAGSRSYNAAQTRVYDSERGSHNSFLALSAGLSQGRTPVELEHLQREYGIAQAQTTFDAAQRDRRGNVDALTSEQHNLFSNNQGGIDTASVRAGIAHTDLGSSDRAVGEGLLSSLHKEQETGARLDLAKSNALEGSPEYLKKVYEGLVNVTDASKRYAEELGKHGDVINSTIKAQKSLTEAQSETSARQQKALEQFQALAKGTPYESDTTYEQASAHRKELGAHIIAQGIAGGDERQGIKDATTLERGFKDASETEGMAALAQNTQDKSHEDSTYSGLTRRMLGGFGLMYMRSLSGIMTGGLGSGEQQVEGLRSTQGMVAANLTGRGSLVENQSQVMQTRLGLYGVGNNPAETVGNFIQTNPAANDAALLAGSGVGSFAMATQIGEWAGKTGAAGQIGGFLTKNAAPIAGVAMAASAIMQISAKVQDSQGTALRMGSEMIRMKQGDIGAMITEGMGLSDAAAFALSPTVRSQTYAYERTGHFMEQGGTAREIAQAERPDGEAQATPESKNASYRRQQQRFGELNTSLDAQTAGRTYSFLERNNIPLEGNLAKMIGANFQMGLDDSYVSARMGTFGQGLGYQLSPDVQTGTTQLGSEYIRTMYKPLDSNQMQLANAGIQMAQNMGGAVAFMDKGGLSQDETMVKMGSIAGTPQGNIYSAQMQNWFQGTMLGNYAAQPTMPTYRDTMSIGAYGKADFEARRGASVNATASQAMDAMSRRGVSYAAARGQVTQNVFNNVAPADQQTAADAFMQRQVGITQIADQRMALGGISAGGANAYAQTFAGAALSEINAQQQLLSGKQNMKDDMAYTFGMTEDQIKANPFYKQYDQLKTGIGQAYGNEIKENAAKIGVGYMRTGMPEEAASMMGQLSLDKGAYYQQAQIERLGRLDQIGGMLGSNFGWDQKRINDYQTTIANAKPWQQEAIGGMLSFDRGSYNTANAYGLKSPLTGTKVPWYMTNGDVDSMGKPTGAAQFTSSMNWGNPFKKDAQGNTMMGANGQPVRDYDSAGNPTGMIGSESMAFMFGKNWQGSQYNFSVPNGQGGNVGLMDAMVNGVEIGNSGVMAKGMMAYQYGMSNLGYQSQMASIGNAMAGIQLQSAFTTGVGLDKYAGTINPQTGGPFANFNTGKSSFNVPGIASYSSVGGGIWGNQDAQMNLGWAQQTFQFEQQQKQMNLQSSQFYENQGLNQKQSLMNRQFTKQDWNYQDQQRDLNWQWNQEDYQFNIRFMTGRDRKQAEKQHNRDTISHDLEGNQIDTQRSNQQETWKLEDERFAIEKKQYEESKKLQQDQLVAARDFFAEQKKLQLEATALQRAEWVAQMDLQKQALGSQAYYAQKQKEASDMMMIIQLAQIENGKLFDENGKKQQAAGLSGQKSQDDIQKAQDATFLQWAQKLKDIQTALANLKMPSPLADPKVGKAIGGFETPGQTYIVGEKGPELHTEENGAGRIYPAEQLDPWRASQVAFSANAKTQTNTIVINIGNERLGKFVVSTLNEKLGV